MPSYYQLPREIYDNVPDGFKFVQRRRFSFDLPTSPSKRELYDLQVELDHQSLQHAAGLELEHDVTSAANSAKLAALSLSGPLNECQCSGSFEFQQIQFRALVASLALLQHSGVAALNQAPREKLKDELAARFQPVPYQISSRTTLAEKMLYTPSIYLIQLASQYMSFVGRGDSMLPLIAGPAFKILFATLAIVGSQYNHAQQILQALNELLSLRQKPQAKYRALCSLQEYIRLVISLTRESERDSTPVAERQQVRESVAPVVSTLLDEIYALLVEKGQEHPRGRPKLGGQWPRLRAAMGRGPPDLDRAWFYYGLLDCTTQLSSLTDANTLHHKGILDEMKELIFKGECPEYRWKAMEVLLSCRDPHNAMYNILKKEMEERPGLEAREPGREARETLLEELKTVREQLDHNERHGLQFCLSSPLTGESLSEISLRSNYQEGEVKPPTVESMQAEPATEIPRFDTPDNLAASWLEQDLVVSRPVKTQVLQMSFPKHGLFKSNVTYHFGGLSTDCRYGVLYNAAEMVVFRLEPFDPSNSSSFPSILRKRFTNENIFNVVLGRRSLIVVTDKCLHALDISRGDEHLGIIPHGKFDHSGITCHEDGTHLVIMLGQRQWDTKGGYIKGRIQIIKFKFGKGKSSETETISLPDRDCPKLLSYNADTKILVCITRLKHRIVAWELDHNFLPLNDDPIVFGRNQYAEETKVTGITSASTFTGPSGAIYVACTTSPSSERWRNDGEWSFIVPLPFTRGPRLRPPNPPCHDLKQFGKHHALTLGCVSTKHNVLAVLERSGVISVLSLKSHETGGICGEGHAKRLSEALFKQEKPSTSCLHFDPDGERLFAIDPKGKIIITEFEKV